MLTQRGSHDPGGVHLGGPLAVVGTVRELQPVAVVGARDGAPAWLNDVGEFVGEVRTGPVVEGVN